MKKHFPLIFKPLKLRQILSILFVAFILFVTILIIVPSFYLFKQQLIENISQGRVDTLSQVDSNLDKIKGEIITISDMFFNDESLNQMISSPNLDESSKTEYNSIIKELDHKVRSTLSNYSFEYEMQLISENGILYSTDSSKRKDLPLYPNELWYYKAVNAKEPLYWLSSLRTKASTSNDRNYFSLLRFIKNEENQNTAILMINIPERFLYNTYSDLISESGNIYIVETSGQIISHTTESMIGHFYYKMPVFYELFGDSNSATINKSDVPYLFSKYTTEDSSWIVVEEIPMSTILYPLKKIQNAVMTIALLVCGISIIAATMVSWTISRPLTAVYASMNQAQTGDFNVTFPKKGFAETRWIAEACENFVVRIVSLLNDIKKKEHLKRVTELHFLQMQINPHFMHNTLFSIKCMIDMGKSEEACQMLDALNAMLKNILNCEQQLVTVQEEVDLLKQSSYILQQRYRNSFHIKFIIDEECNALLILRFILQPIIENSVFHGFTSNKEEKIIVVRVSCNESYITLKVIDNGCGMSPETLKQIMNSNGKDGHHIGLKNISSRLTLHYNNSAHFEISSRENKGTTVKITVPRYTM